MAVEVAYLFWEFNVTAAVFIFILCSVVMLCLVCILLTIFTPPYGSLEGYLVYCNFFCLSFVCFFVRLRISQQRKKLGRQILHACWPTIRTGLLPFWQHYVGMSHLSTVQPPHQQLCSRTRGEFDISAGTCSGGRLAFRIGGGGVA